MSDVEVNDILARQLAENLRSYREKRLLSQERLGQILDKHRTYIGRIESGRENVSLANIAGMAADLGVHPRELLDGELIRADHQAWTEAHPPEATEEVLPRRRLRAAADGRDPGKRRRA